MDDFLRTAEYEGCSEGRQTKRYIQSTHPLRGSDSLGIWTETKTTDKYVNDR